MSNRPLRLLFPADRSAQLAFRWARLLVHTYSNPKLKHHLGHRTAGDLFGQLVPADYLCKKKAPSSAYVENLYTTENTLNSNFLWLRSMCERVNKEKNKNKLAKVTHRLSHWKSPERQKPNRIVRPHTFLHLPNYSNRYEYLKIP